MCYAVKANSNLSVLRLLARLGSSFDIVSGGELDRLRRIGVRGSRIVFSGVGKTREEIREALRYPGKRVRPGGIFLFNVESEAELEVLLDEAADHIAAGGEAPAAAIRVNPDVLAGGHRHISTGHHQHKFGVDWAQARNLYVAHKDSRLIAWRGISAHIGSQVLSVAPYRRALQRVASYVRELARLGIALDHVDIGGGLGIATRTNIRLDVELLARTLSKIVRPLGCRLLIEPGRTLVGPAGVLLTRVLYLKENGGKKFVVVDAAMNDLIRPVLYEAVHQITKVVRDATGVAKSRVDVVGPICETGDFLARDYPLEPVEEGDLLAVWAGPERTDSRNLPTTMREDALPKFSSRGIRFALRGAVRPTRISSAEKSAILPVERGCFLGQRQHNHQPPRAVRSHNDNFFDVGRAARPGDQAEE